MRGDHEWRVLHEAAVIHEIGANLVTLCYATGWVLVPGALLGLIWTLVRPRSRAERALGAVTVESMRADPHSIAAGLFQHRHQPQFGFTRGEQELLEVALEGMEDAAASESLFVSVAAIKRR